MELSARRGDLGADNGDARPPSDYISSLQPE